MGHVVRPGRGRSPAGAASTWAPQRSRATCRAIIGSLLAGRTRSAWTPPPMSSRSPPGPRSRSTSTGSSSTSRPTSRPETPIPTKQPTPILNGFSDPSRRRDGDVAISKWSAGRWALEHLPDRWHPALAAACRAYDGEPAPEDADLLAREMAPFVAMVRERMPPSTARDPGHRLAGPDPEDTGGRAIPDARWRVPGGQ